MSTANVVAVKSGSGFTVDVTACDLLDDLLVKDFLVFHDQSLVSNALYDKTSPTLLTYNGASLPSTTVEVRRKTPNNVIQPVTFGDRFSSSLWNNELDRNIRWREEADLNGVGGLALTDYSFGSMTITNNGDATGVIGQQGGTYIKIGRYVHVSFGFSVTSNFTGDAVNGLPFPPAENGFTASNLECVGSLVTGGSNTIRVIGLLNRTTLTFREGNGTVAHFPTIADSAYRGSMSYYTVA